MTNQPTNQPTNIAYYAIDVRSDIAWADQHLVWKGARFQMKVVNVGDVILTIDVFTISGS
jgi:hypothetical protein